jgi:hypothetical protein
VLDNFAMSTPIASQLPMALEMRSDQYLILIAENPSDVEGAFAKLQWSAEDRDARTLNVHGLLESELTRLRRMVIECRTQGRIEFSAPGWLELSHRMDALPGVLHVLVLCLRRMPMMGSGPELALRARIKKDEAAAEVLNLWTQAAGAGAGLPGVLLLALCSASAVGMAESDLQAVVQDSLMSDAPTDELRAALDTIIEAGLAQNVLVGGQVVYIPKLWVRSAIRRLMSRPATASRLTKHVIQWRRTYLEGMRSGPGFPWSTAERAVLHAQLFFDELGSARSVEDALRAEHHLQKMLAIVESPGFDRLSCWLSVLRRFNTLSRNCSAVIGLMHVVTQLKPNRAIGDLSFRMRHHDGWANAACIFAATYHWTEAPSLTSPYGIDVIIELKERLKELAKLADDDMEIAAIFGALATMGEWKSVVEYWRNVAPRFRVTTLADLTFLVIANDVGDEDNFRWAAAVRWPHALDERHKRVVAAFLRRQRGKDFVLWTPGDAPKDDKLLVDATTMVAECAQSAAFARFVATLDEPASADDASGPLVALPDLLAEKDTDDAIPRMKKRPVSVGGNNAWFLEERTAGD